MAPFIMNPFRFGGGAVGSWKELDRTTLGSSNATIDVTSLDNKQYLMMLCTSTGTSAGANTGSQFNGDTANNYSARGSNNGGADYTNVNFPDMEAGATGTTPYWQVAYASNLAGKEKLLQSSLVAQNTAGAGTAPFRNNSVGKWANTSNAVSSYQWITSAASTFNTGSEVVVLGYDPTDTHTDTDNFWQELASVELGVTADELSSGTILAKKYLMVEYYVKKTGTANTRWRFNNDTGSNYAARQSGNGAADGTVVNQTSIYTHADTSANAYGKIFIINNSANEKLGMFDEVSEGAATAGTAPARREVVAKWTNTSSQVTEIDLLNTDTGGFESGTLMKVWGSD